MNSITEKQCSKCERLFPITGEYFYRDCNRADGFGAACKKCKNKPSKRGKHIDGKKQCSMCKDWLPATTDHFGVTSVNWDGLNYRCIRCNRVYTKKYYAENPEKCREKVRRFRINNPESTKASEQKRYWSNPEKERQRVKDYRANPIVKAREKVRMREWVAENREKVLFNAKRYSHLRRSAEGDYTQSDIDTLHRTQKGLCWWCGKKLNGTYHIDHRIAISRGGTNWPNNLCLACPHCNVSKHNKMAWEWSDRLL